MFTCDFLFVLSCVVSGLAMGSPPLQGVLPTVRKFHNFRFIYLIVNGNRPHRRTNMLRGCGVIHLAPDMIPGGFF
jgi:hypothetical protein